MIPIQKQPILTVSKQLVTEKELHTYCTNGGMDRSLCLCASCQKGVHACTQKRSNIHQITNCSAIQLLCYYKDRIL